jgi:hypothetical protein
MAIGGKDARLGAMDEPCLLAAARYVELNPVQAQLAERAGDSRRRAHRPPARLGRVHRPPRLSRSLGRRKPAPRLADDGPGEGDTDRK